MLLAGAGFQIGNPQGRGVSLWKLARLTGLSKINFIDEIHGQGEVYRCEDY